MARYARLRVATETATGLRYVLDRVTSGKARCYGDVVATRGELLTFERGGKNFPVDAVSIAEVDATEELAQELLAQTARLRGRPVVSQASVRRAAAKSRRDAEARVKPVLDAMDRGDLGPLADLLDRALGTPGANREGLSVPPAEG